jgi:hypothetical protein
MSRGDIYEGFRRLAGEWRKGLGGKALRAADYVASAYGIHRIGLVR